jgi:hypothetical protein
VCEERICPTVLLGSIGATGAEDPAIRGEEGLKRVVVKFAAIVDLQASDRSIELSANVSMKTDYSGQNFRLLAQRKCPNIMGMIIKNHKIVFVARVTDHR